MQSILFLLELWAVSSNCTVLQTNSSDNFTFVHNNNTHFDYEYEIITEAAGNQIFSSSLVVLPQLGGSLRPWPGNQQTASYPSLGLVFQCLHTYQFLEPVYLPCLLAWLFYGHRQQTFGTSLQSVSPHWLYFPESFLSGCPWRRWSTTQVIVIK